MWGIENPIRTFSYLQPFAENHAFQLMAIINKEKYNSFRITSYNVCYTKLLRFSVLSALSADTEVIPLRTSVINLSGFFIAFLA